MLRLQRPTQHRQLLGQGAACIGCLAWKHPPKGHANSCPESAQPTSLVVVVVVVVGAVVPLLRLPLPPLAVPSSAPSGDRPLRLSPLS